MSYSVAKNTSFLTIASIGQKIVSFVYFTVIARLIGVEDTGLYFFALTFTNIFAVVADFGMANVLTRETAKHPTEKQTFFAAAFTGKFVFGVLAYIGIVVAVNLLNYPEATKLLIYLAGLTVLLDNFHSLFYAVLRAERNLKIESFGLVGSQIITLVIGSTALYLGAPLIWLIGAYTIASLANVIYSGWFALRIAGVKLAWILNWLVVRSVLTMAWPFALAGLIGRLYAYSDSLLMSKMLTGRELGWWSVPYKIIFAFQFIPLALSASVYPVFSALNLSDKPAVARLFERSWRYLLIVIVPLAAGLYSIAWPFITQVYGGSYEPSVIILRVLSFSLIFGYLSIISGAFLNAVNRQKTQTGIMAVVLIINVALNIWLLPRIGIMGAAISALVGNIIVWSLGIYFVSREAPINFLNLFWHFLRIIFAALIMAAVVMWLSGQLSYLWAIPVGVIVYGLLIFLSKELEVGQLVALKNKLFNSI